VVAKVKIFILTPEFVLTFSLQHTYLLLSAAQRACVTSKFALILAIYLDKMVSVVRALPPAYLTQGPTNQHVAASFCMDDWGRGRWYLERCRDDGWTGY
jgi:hypothetical protein